MGYTKEQKKIMKKNLAFKIHRWVVSVPKNTVLIQENIFNKEAEVVEGGFKAFMPWLKTVGLSLDARTYDFPPQVFQTGVSQKSENQNGENQNGENFDIEVDAAITYRIKGGDRPDEEIIKADNKELRREWRKKHGALKVYFDLSFNFKLF